MSKERPVYSTAANFAKNQPKKAKRADEPLASGPLKIRRESKGRGGKTVTVIYNLAFTKSAAKDHMRMLQSHLACGASFKDNTILLQGDVLTAAMEYFSDKGIKIIQAGA